MRYGPLLDKIIHRVALDREEGDIAYFSALTLYFEYVTKIVTAGLLACLSDEADRHRYALEHKLVRANSIGDWAEAINHALTGPPAHFFYPYGRDIIRDLTERVPSGDWRYSAVQNMDNAARELGIQTGIGARAALRQFFQIGASIRNRTRGHGATTSRQCGYLCPLIADAIELVINGSQIFKLPWVYLHRNLSGKYRISPLIGDCTPMDYLKKERNVRLPNGVFFWLDGTIYVPLIFSDPDLTDIFLPNGNFNSGTFEVLSYITNESTREDGSLWITPPTTLPRSETEGRIALEQIGNTFSNLPPMLKGYVKRRLLEERLKEELLLTDRHPVLSLTGPGGIGKTSLAITAIEDIALLEAPPYDVVLWISARDIDLLESGPKPVTPRVTTPKEIALAAVKLLEPSESNNVNFKPLEHFQQCLENGAAGPTLFVLDNFETLDNPSDVFKWIDTYIRPPNKVLITTRFRDFAGDYPINVEGMTDDEASNLIDQESTRLGISGLIKTDYREELLKESDGHPYVIKILLGQVAKERRAVTPERIVATSEHLLRALFERTYTNLTPAAQRVFLMLCSWRVFVPEVAVEAVLLRPGSQRFDVNSALSELRRFSLIEEAGEQDHRFIGVPLAAASYGRRKLEASQFKIAVEEDRKILMEFGAGKRSDVKKGVLPRINNLMKSVAERSTRTGVEALEKELPVLEYLASRHHEAYLMLSDLVLQEGDLSIRNVERAKTYLRSYIEAADFGEKETGWMRLANLCQATDDIIGEVHALGEVARLPTSSIEIISTAANRINNRIRDLKGERVEEAWPPAIKELIERVIVSMDRHMNRLSATDCSRLAWLNLHIGNEDRARDIAKIGLERDSNNEHCLNLIIRLGA